MDKIKSFRDLQVWQKAVELATKIYQITEAFPKTEQYGLTSQMRRAAVSIASNIAEGHRRTNPDFARYLTIALGSVAELETQIEIAKRIDYLTGPTYTDSLNDLGILGRQLTVLHQRVVGQRLAPSNQPPDTSD